MLPFPAALQKVSAAARDSEPVRYDEELSRRLRKWAILFVVTLAGSVAYVWLFSSAEHGSNPVASHAANGSATASAPSLDAAITAELRDTLAYVRANLHPAPQPLQAALQGALVVGLAFLWFYSFLVAASAKQLRTTAPAVLLSFPRKRRRFNLTSIPTPVIGLSFVPALMFAFAMYKAYQPAVFVMALAAIFVAAEHYGSLDETRLTLEKANSALDNVQRHTDLLLNADGLAKWRANVYERYKTATGRIDAVVRHFDVDDSFLKLHPTDVDLWRNYRNAIENPNLFRSLTDSPGKKPVRTDDVLFVGHLCWPRGRGSTADDRADYFEALWSLTWQLVVLEMVRHNRALASTRPNNRCDQISVRIANAPAWMHAIDDTVFQLVDHGSAGSASARDLTGEMRDLDKRRRLSIWAHEDVQRSGHRGCHAEEYVCSVFRDAALRRTHLNDDNLLDDANVARVLDSLGLADWLTLRSPTLNMPVASADHLRTLCIRTFKEFFAQREVDWRGHPRAGDGEEVRVGDLLLQLM